MIWITLAVMTMVAGLLVLRSSGRGVIVLGQDLANARANEKARLEAGVTGPSPLPNRTYEAERGDYRLVSVTLLPLDTELQTFVRTFSSWDIERRSKVQQAISMDEQYTLIHFAKRMVVLAVNENSAARCEDGILALSLIDETRIDPRDALWAVGLLNYAIAATGADRKQLIDRATTVATPGMGTLLTKSNASAKLSDWGYIAVRAEDGKVGLFEMLR